MKYSDAIQLMPNASYIYINVTEEEIADVQLHKYVSYLDDVAILGTDLPVEELEDKELIAGSISFN